MKILQNLPNIAPPKPSGKCGLNVSCPQSLEMCCFLAFEASRNDHKLIF